IRMFGGSFAPLGWLYCDGSLLQIGAYNDLFNVIGTAYGGDGTSNFALPNLCGRYPVHQGAGYSLGMVFGTDTVTLTTPQLPSHNHAALGSGTTATSQSPSGSKMGTPGGGGAGVLYIPPDATFTHMNAAAVQATGAGGAHNNMHPF